MPRHVIDASTSLAWCFNEKGRGRSLAPLLLASELVAPWLWRLEVVPAVTKRERRNRITVAQATRYLQALENLQIEFVGEPGQRSLVELAQTARPHQLTSYDATYLDLAVRSGLPLIADDGNLRIAAERLGVPLVDLPPPPKP